MLSEKNSATLDLSSSQNRLVVSLAQSRSTLAVATARTFTLYGSPTTHLRGRRAGVLPGDLQGKRL